MVLSPSVTAMLPLRSAAILGFQYDFQYDFSRLPYVWMEVRSFTSCWANGAYAGWVKH